MDELQEYKPTVAQRRTLKQLGIKNYGMIFDKVRMWLPDGVVGTILPDGTLERFDTKRTQ